jgi:EEF1A lysine methyltransferase 2
VRDIAVTITVTYLILDCNRFGEDSIEKMVDWVQDYVAKDPPPTIVEVGSGNGSLLFALHEAGYDAARILGIDYSEDAIKLAQSIGASRGNGAEAISFAACDFLHAYPKALSSMQNTEQVLPTWDLVLDKGTFDAIALAAKDESGKAPAADYPSRIGAIVNPNGYFLITCKYDVNIPLRNTFILRPIACNFTEEELIAKFTTPQIGLQYQCALLCLPFAHQQIHLQISIAPKYLGHGSPLVGKKETFTRHWLFRSRHESSRHNNTT